MTVSYSNSCKWRLVAFDVQRRQPLKLNELKIIVLQTEICFDPVTYSLIQGYILLHFVVYSGVCNVTCFRFLSDIYDITSNTY